MQGIFSYIFLKNIHKSIWKEHFDRYFFYCTCFYGLFSETMSAMSQSETIRLFRTAAVDAAIWQQEKVEESRSRRIRITARYIHIYGPHRTTPIRLGFMNLTPTRRTAKEHAHLLSTPSSLGRHMRTDVPTHKRKKSSIARYDSVKSKDGGMDYGHE